MFKAICKQNRKAFGSGFFLLVVFLLFKKYQAQTQISVKISNNAVLKWYLEICDVIFFLDLIFSGLLRV